MIWVVNIVRCPKIFIITIEIGTKINERVGKMDFLKSPMASQFSEKLQHLASPRGQNKHNAFGKSLFPSGREKCKLKLLSIIFCV